MRVTQARAAGTRRNSSVANATAAHDASLSSPDQLVTEVRSLADIKRLKHREYVKKSYNKKIVRPAGRSHSLMKS